MAFHVAFRVATPNSWDVARAAAPANNATAGNSVQGKPANIRRLWSGIDNKRTNNKKHLEWAFVQWKKKEYVADRERSEVEKKKSLLCMKLAKVSPHFQGFSYRYRT